MTNSRIGNFSSSSIWMLTTNGRAKDSVGATFHTYVQEKIYEARLGRQLDSENQSRACSWGNLCEDIPLAIMGKENQNKNERLKHPKLRWSGQPDHIENKGVGDIKCPFTLKSFCGLYEIDSGEELKRVKREYYWQLVSNMVLANKEKCKLTIFAPYQDQLDSIRELAQAVEGETQNYYAWVNWANDSELPYIPRGGYYQNIKTLTFIPSQEDVNFLIGRVEKATKILEANI